MTERNYRKLARFLFLLLFLVFFLLYLLMSGRFGGQQEDGDGWGIHRAKSLGTVEVSDVLSSGFIIDEFSFTQTTSLTEGTAFDGCVKHFKADVKNIASVPVQVKLRISGTNISSDAITNAGLHCFAYYFSGKDDPFPAGYRAALTSPNSTLETTDFAQRRLSLTTDPVNYPLNFTLDPDEEIHLMLVFWVDHDEAIALSPALESQLGELESEIVDVSFNDQFNVTVKLSSRKAELP